MAQNENTFDPSQVPKRFDAEECEKKWSSKWIRSGIYHYDANGAGSEIFSIDAPPPTVSGSLHIGHVFSYTHKDIIARFMRMNGRNVLYPMGWDDNGLPTERRVQNYYRIRCSPEEPYVNDYRPKMATSKMRKSHPKAVSRRNFVELCSQLTKVDEKAFKHLWTQCGLSCDWRLEYSTIDRNSIRQAQLSFLDLYGKGHIEQRFAPTTWDVDFETAVAQAELEDRESQTVFYRIRFRLADGPGSIVIATTRPELLPACVGVTAHPDDSRYKHLFGKQAITPLLSVPVRIFPSEDADPAKGTGIVMVCTFGDATDVEWWQRESLPLRQILTKQGRLKNVTFGEGIWESRDSETANRRYRDLIGTTAVSAREIILKQLSEPDIADPDQMVPLVESRKPEMHTAKYYEKGRQPVEYLATRQWFVKILDKKDRFINAGKQINWHPSYMLARYISWCENLAYDWCISRQRCFGVPLPIWFKTDRQGNKDYSCPILANEEDLPVDPSVDAPSGYRADMRDKPNAFAAETDVFDTWFTSSLTPYIARGIDCNAPEKMSPMSLRSQGHDIIRTWAFYTIVKSLLHQDSIPWESIMISGWVLDPDRKKMSKSKGNVEIPDSFLRRYTPDGVRYWSANAYPGRDTAIDEHVMKTGRKLVTKIYNAAKFTVAYPAPEDAGITEDVDTSFLLALRDAVEQITEAYRAYRISEALKKTEDFFYKRFTDVYIELVKGRLKGATGDRRSRISAAASSHTALNILLRLFAPVMPFITEEIWSWAFAGKEKNGSIHIASWPDRRDFESVDGSRQSGSFDAAAAMMHRINRIRTERRLANSQMLDIFEAEQTELYEIEACLEDVKSACKVRTVSVRR